MRKKEYGFQLFILIILIPFVIVGHFFITLRDQQKIFYETVKIWEPQISLSLINNDRAFIENLAHSLFGLLEYVEIQNELETLYTLPNEQERTKCWSEASLPIYHYGAFVGKIRGCFQGKQILKKTLRSPLLIGMILSLVALTFLFSLIYLLRYRTEVEKILERIMAEIKLPFSKSSGNPFSILSQNHQHPTPTPFPISSSTTPKIGQKLWNLIHEVVEIRSMNERLLTEAKNQEVLMNLASQVSHDIRSPLTALNLVLDDLDLNAGEKGDRKKIARLAVERINEIANQLLNQYRSHLQNQVPSSRGSPTTPSKFSISSVAPMIPRCPMESRIPLMDSSILSSSPRTSPKPSASPKPKTSDGDEDLVFLPSIIQEVVSEQRVLLQKNPRPPHLEVKIQTLIPNDEPDLKPLILQIGQVGNLQQLESKPLPCSEVFSEISLEMPSERILDPPLKGEYFIKFSNLELRRILSNLMNNAVAATSENPDGRILISLSLSEDSNHSKSKELSPPQGTSNIEIKISDNGRGIPPHILRRLGERGFSYDNPTGSGLGIYHAKKTMEKLGGDLFIESQESKGTAVILRFFHNR